jgi:hypothetical protein
LIILQVKGSICTIPIVLLARLTSPPLFFKPHRDAPCRSLTDKNACLVISEAKVGWNTWEVTAGELKQPGAGQMPQQEFVLTRTERCLPVDVFVDGRRNEVQSRKAHRKGAASKEITERTCIGELRF